MARLTNRLSDDARFAKQASYVMDAAILLLVGLPWFLYLAFAADTPNFNIVVMARNTYASLVASLVIPCCGCAMVLEQFKQRMGRISALVALAAGPIAALFLVSMAYIAALVEPQDLQFFTGARRCATAPSYLVAAKLALTVFGVHTLWWIKAMFGSRDISSKRRNAA